MKNDDPSDPFTVPGNQEQENMDESNQQDGERANDDTQTEKEKETEGEPNKLMRT